MKYVNVAQVLVRTHSSNFGVGMMGIVARATFADRTNPNRTYWPPCRVTRLRLLTTVVYVPEPEN